MEFQNVFVLCTGRCGSTTIVRAMEHSTNYSAGHETRSHLLGDARLAYPPRHFEADNRLSWFLGRLETAFGQSAFYVHLTRDVEDVVRSMVARKDIGIMLAYSQGLVMNGQKRNPGASDEAFARDLVETVTANITDFLRDKPHQMAFRLERASTDFPELWRRIGATGDMPSAMAEFMFRHNEGVPTAG
jgi:hypothetical protein